MSEQCISFEDLTFGYKDDAPLFTELNLQFLKGRFYFLTGVSGSGKSSLLRLMYLALRPQSGSLRIFDRSTHKISYHRRSLLRRQMGIVFQDFHLLEHLNVLENVSLPLRIRGLPGGQSNEQARELLAWAGVTSFERSPHELSGGEKQRVAIARAIIAKPKLLFADEPTGSLDDKTALKVFYLFEELHKIGTTIIVATHNKYLIERFQHPTLLCEGGKVFFTRPPLELQTPQAAE